MPNISHIGRPIHERSAMTLLSLLSVICSRNGHTFSWYTSKKRRVWLSLKGFRPITYATAVEVPPDVTDEQMFDAIKVLFAAHFPKLMEEVPPLPTWISTRDVIERLDSANKLVQDLWNRWDAGEVFWKDTTGMENDDAMPAGIDDDEGDVQVSANV